MNFLPGEVLEDFRQALRIVNTHAVGGTPDGEPSVRAERLVRQPLGSEGGHLLCYSGLLR